MQGTFRGLGAMEEYGHSSHLPSLPSPYCRFYFRTYILSFLLSAAALAKGILPSQSKKHGGASRSERMLVLSLKEALKKAKVGQVKFSVFWDSWNQKSEQSPWSLLVPFLLLVRLFSSWSFFLPSLQGSSQPGGGTKRSWISKFTPRSLSHIPDKLRSSLPWFSRNTTVREQEYIIPGSRQPRILKMIWPHWRESRWKYRFLPH